MPITQEEARELLKELSVKKGGSILGKVNRHKLNTNSRILFIGIGGAGCQTVNKIKGAYEAKFEQNPDVKFMCIDTDENDVKALKRENGGNIVVNEIFELYDKDSQRLLIDRPEIVKDWLSTDVPSETIDETGAKSRRVVGRVLLCGTQKYAALEKTIKNLIKGFSANGIIEVVICAGISGGTGSGTFIDISYMVRMILEKLGLEDGISTNLYGVFYTPDVQRSIPEVGDNSAKWKTVQQNGYAAMKELSYFMNVGSEAEIEPVYTLHVIDPAGGERTCSKPIFKRGYAFMVSSTPQVNRFEETIECVAESILNMFRPGQIDAADKTKRQSILSTLCNIGRNVGTWETDVVGIPEAGVDPDPCGIKNTYFPAFMNNSFSSFGYRSVYLPKNEMAAYVANKAFAQIIERYKRAFKFTTDDAHYIAGGLGIDSANDILRSIKDKKGISSQSLRIGKDKYPQRIGTQWLGKMKGLDESILAAKEAAEIKINSMTGLDTCVSNIAYTVQQLLEGKSAFYMPDGRAANLWEEYGPVGANVILAGTDGGGNVHIQGLIGILTDIYNTLPDALTQANTALAQQQNNLEAAKETLQKDSNPHDEEVETFIGACAAYSDAYFDSLFINNYMQQFIGMLIDQLRTYSNETFEIYTPIIMNLADILNEDSDIFAKYYLRHEERRTVFSLNAFNLDGAMERNDLFEKMFEGMVADPETMQLIQNNLTDLLFSADERGNWQAYINSPDLLCDRLRNVFSDAIQPIIGNQLEKFVVLVYGNKDQIVRGNGNNEAIDIAALNNIWNNDDLRDNALREAAGKIVDTISGSALIAFDERLTTAANKFDKTIDIVLLADTPNLNHEIEAELMQRYPGGYSTSVADGLITEISEFECIRPFSPEMVRNMKDYASEYFNAEKLVSNSAGRHLNEVSEKWQTYLPEIYGKDTEDYFVQMIKKPEFSARIQNDKRCIKNGKVFNNDVEMYDEIKKIVEFGLENGYIYTDPTNKYVVCVLGDTSPEFIDRIEKKIVELRSGGGDHTWKDALDSINAEDNHKYYSEIRLERAINNDSLKSRQTNMPGNRFDLKNIYRIVRSDMVMHRLLLEKYNEYKSMNLFENLAGVSEFDRNVSYYIKARQCGMISNDPAKGWFCTYSANEHDKPILFLDDYKKKNEKIDVPFMDFIVFSAFVREALNDVVTDAIDRACDDYQSKNRGAKLPSCQDVLDNINAALNSSLFTMRDIAARNRDIGKQLASSNYFEYYNIPKKCAGPNDAETLIGNFKAFVKALEDLRETGDL